MLESPINSCLRAQLLLDEHPIYLCTNAQLVHARAPDECAPRVPCELTRVPSWAHVAGVVAAQAAATNCPVRVAAGSEVDITTAGLPKCQGRQCEETSGEMPEEMCGQEGGREDVWLQMCFWKRLLWWDTWSSSRCRLWCTQPQPLGSLSASPEGLRWTLRNLGCKQEKLTLGRGIWFKLSLGKWKRK